MTQNKRSLIEQDIRTKHITPAIVEAGWDAQTQVPTGTQCSARSA